ncbi:MAG: 3'-5' exoribonuclease [Magnetococcales bacterium]|nr:3'-5' exoribonuclease [Magnetococcales bacterium]
MAKFVAIDVETANADMSSICSIGAATFENGLIISEWYSLIDPQDYFDDINISIHGIDKSMVNESPTYSEVANTIEQVIEGMVVVTHTHFDRVAISQAARRWSIKPPLCTWLDSARVARRTWAGCAQRGYGLADVCKMIGYEFQHHNALEDAKASGQILLSAMTETGLDLEGVQRRVHQPINPKLGGAIKREGNPEGPLFGEVVAFTGALDIPRREAADLAEALGCNVELGVTKNTTLLVVGDIDVKRLMGHEKSAKHRKAEELAAKGYSIRIVRETDFRELTSLIK